MLLTSLLLAGCATPVKQIEISSKPIEKPALTLPKVAKVKMRDFKWKIINKENVNQIIAEMEKSGDNVVFFTLTDKGYEALALNIADLRKLVQEQQAIIAAYDQYYQNSQAAIDAANAERTAKPQTEGGAKPAKEGCKLDWLCKE
jgi:DNA-binding PadR family transcriptional regulator